MLEKISFGWNEAGRFFVFLFVVINWTFFISRYVNEASLWFQVRVRLFLRNKRSCHCGFVCLVHFDFRFYFIRNASLAPTRLLTASVQYSAWEHRQLKFLGHVKRKGELEDLDLSQWFLTGRASSNFQGGREPLHGLQHRKFFNGNVSLPNVTPVLILRRYMLFGLVPAETEVGVKFFETLQTGFGPACKHSGALLRRYKHHCLVGMPSLFNSNICAVLAFENSTVHIEYQGSRLHRRAARLLPDKHECIHFAQLHATWDTAMAFCNWTIFLQCGLTPAWYQYSAVLPPCSSVMRQCIFMTIQLHLSHTLVECETKFLNAAWQLQASIRCRSLGQER